MKTLHRSALFIVAVVFASQLHAQQIIQFGTNASTATNLAIVAVPRTNPAIVPVSREGKSLERQTLVLQRAKDNQGPCDIAFIGDSITQGWEGLWQPDGSGAPAS